MYSEKGVKINRREHTLTQIRHDGNRTVNLMIGDGEDLLAFILGFC